MSAGARSGGMSGSGSGSGSGSRSRTDELLREYGPDESEESDEPGSAASRPTATSVAPSTTDEGGSSGGWRPEVGLPRVGGRLFDGRGFVLAFLAATAGLVAGSVVPLLPGAGLLGVALGTFLLGAAGSRRRYVECGLAGAVVSGLSLVLTSTNLVLLAALRDLGPQLAVVGAGGGLIAAVVGHYLGRDLRGGLTAEV